MKSFRVLFLSLALIGVSALAQAQAPAPAERSYATDHVGVFNGRRVAYAATVAETILKDGEGTPTASVFTTAYVAKGGDPATRPVLFLFNGGPGAASMWLQMGAFGPTRVALPASPATPIPADAPLVANDRTVLDVADIVFIDPPGTGFGRILPGAKPGAFYQTMRDGDAVATVIARWCADHGRTASPKYLLGESYGTIRVAAVVHTLLKRPDPIMFDGVVILGQALNMIETSSRPTNILAPVVSLPGEAAIAWYHNRTSHQGRTLDQAVAEAETFARGPYLTALAQGTLLPPIERDRIAARVAALTGMRTDYVLAHRLVVSKEALRTELLKDEGQVLGRYDARYTAPAQAGHDVDPSAALSPVYEARLKDYERDILKVPLDPYLSIDPGLKSWDYGSPPSPFSDYPFAQWLADAMTARPRTRLLIGTGIYDLTTTIGAADYLLAQTAFPAGRVRTVRYAAGHMAYTDPVAFRALTDDVRGFILEGAR